MAALLVRRREILARQALPLGWKVGFNAAEIQEKLGIDGPLAGFLTTNGLLEDGAEWSLGKEGEVIVESEVAVELGDDARSIVALLPALELADPPDLSQDVETILVNGEEQHAVDAESAGANLEEMVEAVGRRLEAANERLQPGERIITGILAPPHKAQPGDTVRLELEKVGGVELRFAA